ncbi:MAG: pilus assembly protein TadG-related protein, partial [Gemmatimonadota bacterium]
MNRRSIRTWNDEQGATLVLVALSMFLLLGMAALAVDMAAAFAWRTEAQRVADASALAGASAFLDVPADVADAPARERAYEYALAHTIKGDAVDSSEVTIQVVQDEMLVRVGINRPNMPVWFARILGFASVDIGAVAAAQAAEAGSARCLKPFAVPDAWDDADDDDNGDNVWQEGEEWVWASDPADRYQQFDPDAADASGATGYGSDFRDGDADWGRALQLKAQDPSSEFDPAPGIFLPWRLPADPDMGSCERGGG